MKKLKVVFTATGFSEPARKLWRSKVAGSKLGINAELIFPESDLKLHEALPGADVLIAGPFTRQIFSRAGKLKWVQSHGAGVDRFMFDEFIASVIPLANAKGVHPIPMSEHVFAMMLAFERGLHISLEWQKKREWNDKIELGELAGKTLLLAGPGAIGDRIAMLAKAHGMTVVCIRRDLSKKSGYCDEQYGVDKLADAAGKADHVVNVLPHTKETYKLFNEKIFSRMNPSAYYYNIGRGKTTDENALIRALKEKMIKGAGLDVFEHEPLPKESELWKMENVIITAHIAGETPFYEDRMSDIFIRNLEAFLAGKPMPTLVDKQKGY